MADVSFFRPGSTTPQNQQMAGVANTNNGVLEVTNQMVDADGNPAVDAMGNPIPATTTSIVNVDFDAAGEPTTTYYGDIGFENNAGNAVTVIDLSDMPDGTTMTADGRAIAAGSNSTFVGAANRLNIDNSTGNGAAPLDTTGRKNYDVVTTTETAYEALVMAGTVDPNTLYLIREMV